MRLKKEATEGNITLTPQKAAKVLRSVKWEWTSDGSKSKVHDYNAIRGNKAQGIGVYCPNLFQVSFLDYSNVQPKDKLSFEVPTDYRVYRHTGKDWMSSNPADILVLRGMMWHEIMECAFVYLSLFDGRFDDSYDLKGRLGPSFNQNPIHNKVLERERETLSTHQLSIIGISPPDPPGCSDERAAWAYEGDAQAAQGWAKFYEYSNWSQAAQKWEEARLYWQKAADSWRQIVAGQSMDAPAFAQGWFRCHPDPEGNASRCEGNAKTAKEQEEAALKKAKQ